MSAANPAPGPQGRNPNAEKLYGFAIAIVLLLVIGFFWKSCGR